MAEKGYFFDAVAGTPSYSGPDFIKFFEGFRVDGVRNISGGGLLVTEQGPQALAVNVAAGFYFSSVNGGGYMGELDVQKGLVIGANISGSTRIDSVVGEIDIQNRASSVKVIPGTPGAGAPTLTNTSLKRQVELARVTVANNASVMANANIADTRIDCKAINATGVVTDATHRFATDAQLTIVNSATALATAGAVVARDGSGNFAANKVSGLAAPSAGGDAVNKTYVDALGDPGWAVRAPSLLTRVNTLGAADVVNVTEEGKLLAIGGRANITGFSGRLNIRIDGGTTYYIPVAANTVLASEMLCFGFSAISGVVTDHWYMHLDVHYKTSLQVQWEVTGANAGTTEVSVLRATRI